MALKPTVFAVATFLLFHSLSATLTFAEPLYTLTDLGDMGVSSIQPEGINDLGQIVGSGYTYNDSGDFVTRGFLWKDGVLTTLSDLPGGDDQSIASDINNDGTIVGYSLAGDGFHMVSWDDDLAIHDLERGYGQNVSNAGEFVGRTPPSHGVLIRDGVRTSLGDLPGGEIYSRAFGINDHSQVVGESIASDGLHAFLWEDGSMLDLGGLSGFTESHAQSVNNLGQIVGWSIDADGRSAVMWQDGEIVDLGALPGAVGNNGAWAINDQLQVVGNSQVAPGLSGFRGFLWDSENGMRDLNDLTDGIPDGWTIGGAVGINSSSQIAASIIDSNGDFRRAVLLTPVPEPNSGLVLLAGVAAVVYRGRNFARRSSSRRRSGVTTTR
ncbi:MAG: hypothetical protein R3E01_33585 [Pirellulaceae bacterium]|nr:hypothetical protein [Planctomycetales bacterium]MCA9265677.1 hypothetical protein [Planctomycetales bacterium]